MGQGPLEVAHDDVGVGEVDHHLRVAQPLDGVVLVDRRHQLGVGGSLDGLADFLTNAPSGAKHSYPDHRVRLLDSPGAAKVAMSCVHLCIEALA
ncbi:hypothetical protein GCM10022248_13040 [Nonomuraea soli]